MWIKTVLKIAHVIYQNFLQKTFRAIVTQILFFCATANMEIVLKHINGN